jgi:hypothetical protein
MLERPPKPPARRRTRGAVTSHEHRSRAREGVWRCVQTPIHARVLEAMIDRGLSDEDSHSPRAVAREAGDVLRQWANRWFAEKDS